MIKNDKKRITKLLLALFILSILLFTAACAKEEAKVTIASKPMTEQYILVEMLDLLIQDRTDIQVEKKLGIGGGTSNIHPAMLAGEIDIYPEYTGTAWLFVLEEKLIRDPDDLYEQVKEAYQETFDIYWSGLYGFNDAFGLAIDGDLAESLNIETYSDLSNYAGNLVFGAEYDFYEREDGFPGLVEAYGFSFADTVEMDIGLKYQAIDGEEVDVINIFTTDGRLAQYNLRVLEDDLNFFPSYYGASLVRQETLEAFPDLKEVLALLDGQISEAQMTQMNYEVEINHLEPRQVAEDFLKEKDLL